MWTTQAELQKHQPQVGLHRNRRATDAGVEMRREWRKESRVVQQHIHAPDPTRPATPTARAAGSHPTTSIGRLQFSARWPRSLLAQGVEAILSSTNTHF